MKYNSLMLIMLSYLITGCATDPLTVRYNNWQAVTRSISSYQPSFKECKKPYAEKMDKNYVIYTFNIVKDSADNVLTFNDPYQLSNSFHKCVRDGLSSIQFKLDKTNELRNGYLLINKDIEKFNYVIY